MPHWQIITGEYPPQTGGVSDYTRLVACGLAGTGDEVEVWAPRCPGPELEDPGVRIHRLPGHFGLRALAVVDRAIAGANGDRILVQYTPHAFGFKAMNLPFCCWLLARRRLAITVMFHEVAFPRRMAQPFRHNLLGEATSLMAMLVGRSAARIFVASSSWEGMLRPLLPAGRPIRPLPVPSNVPVVNDCRKIRDIKAHYVPAGGFLAGHFSTYGKGIRDYLEILLPELLGSRAINAILLGRGGPDFRDAILRRHPDMAGRLHAVGGLIPEELSIHLSACDLMIQPYPDGISTRHGSAMAALSHGRAVVTTSGRLTEALWEKSGAVAMVGDRDLPGLSKTLADLRDDQAGRRRLGRAAGMFYRDQFDVCHTIAGLRAA